MRGTPVRQIDFTGGLNTKAAPYLVEPNECRDCLNVVTTTRGSIKKRNGNTTHRSGLGAGSTDVQALFGAIGVPTAGNVLIAIDEDGDCFSITTAGAFTDILAAAFFASPLTVSIIQAPVQGGQGPIYFSDGATNNQWPGAGNIAAWTATSGTVPLGIYSIYFKNRVWIAGQAANPSRLFWSDIANPRIWPAANAVDFDPTDGGAITGIGTCGPYLLVFKENKAWVVYDLDTGANRPLGTNIGCASHRSIVETPKGTFFLTKDKGVWVTDGKRLSLVSEKITPTLDGIVPGQRNHAAGGYLNDHYYLSICTTGTTNNITLDYDTTTKSWWMHSNSANQFAVWRPVDEQQLFSGHSTGGTIATVSRCYVPGTLTDDGATYESRWTGPWIAFQEPYRNKRLRQIHVDGSGVVDAYIARGFSSAATLVDDDIFNYVAGAPTFGGSGSFGVDGTYGGSLDVLGRRLYTLGVARAFSFIIKANNANTLEMDSYTMYITLRQN